MHMWHHVTNHLITSNDKDSNSENRIKLRVRDKGTLHGNGSFPFNYNSNLQAYTRAFLEKFR
jgi:hypothetical protein